MGCRCSGREREREGDGGQGRAPRHISAVVRPCCGGLANRGGVPAVPPQVTSSWRVGLPPRSSAAPSSEPNPIASMVRPPATRPAPQSAVSSPRREGLHKKIYLHPGPFFSLVSHPFTATARPHNDNAGSDELPSFQLNLSAGDLFRLRPERAALREAGLAAGRGAKHVGAVLAHHHGLSVGEHRRNDEAIRTPHVHEI